MISLRRILGSALLALVSLTGLAQPRTVVLSGYVRDAESGEPLPQAVVFLEDRKTPSAFIRCMSPWESIPSIAPTSAM